MNEQNVVSMKLVVTRFIRQMDYIMFVFCFFVSWLTKVAWKPECEIYFVLLFSDNKQDFSKQKQNIWGLYYLHLAFRYFIIILSLFYS